MRERDGLSAGGSGIRTISPSLEGTPVRPGSANSTPRKRGIRRFGPGYLRYRSFGMGAPHVSCLSVGGSAGGMKARSIHRPSIHQAGRAPAYDRAAAEGRASLPIKRPTCIARPTGLRLSDSSPQRPICSTGAGARRAPCPPCDSLTGRATWLGGSCTQLPP